MAEAKPVAGPMVVPAQVSAPAALVVIFIFIGAIGRVDAIDRIVVAKIR